MLNTYKEKDQVLFSEVAKLMNGDESSYQKIYELSEKYIYKIIHDIVKDHHTTEDIMQDTYVQIYNKINTLQSANAFYVWAGRIATNFTLRHIQKNRREVIPMADEEGSTDFVFEKATDDTENFIPENVLMDREKQRLIGEIVDRLSVEQKLAVQYFYYEEMSVSEIAQAMRCSTGTVKSRLNYARKSIKEAVIDLDVKQGTRLYSLAAAPLFLMAFRVGVADLIAAGVGTATAAGAVSMAGAAGGNAAVASGASVAGEAMTSGVSVIGEAAVGSASVAEVSMTGGAVTGAAASSAATVVTETAAAGGAVVGEAATVVGAVTTGGAAIGATGGAAAAGAGALATKIAIVVGAVALVGGIAVSTIKPFQKQEPTQNVVQESVEGEKEQTVVGGRNTLEISSITMKNSSGKYYAQYEEAVREGEVLLEYEWEGDHYFKQVPDLEVNYNNKKGDISLTSNIMSQEKLDEVLAYFEYLEESLPEKYGQDIIVEEGSTYSKEFIFEIDGKVYGWEIIHIGYGKGTQYYDALGDEPFLCTSIHIFGHLKEKGEAEITVEEKIQEQETAEIKNEKVVKETVEGEETGQEILANIYVVENSSGKYYGQWTENVREGTAHVDMEYEGLNFYKKAPDLELIYRSSSDSEYFSGDISFASKMMSGETLNDLWEYVDFLKSNLPEEESNYIVIEEGSVYEKSFLIEKDGIMYEWIIEKISYNTKKDFVVFGLGDASSPVSEVHASMLEVHIEGTMKKKM